MSPVFGTVSSLHPTSFLMIFVLVGYRDDIVPKAVDIAKKVGLKAGNNLPQPYPFLEVAEDCCKLLT